VGKCEPQNSGKMQQASNVFTQEPIQIIAPKQIYMQNVYNPEAFKFPSDL
jgi:hypothetical protein